MQTKYCKRCGQTLPIDQFHKSKRGGDGHAFYCKGCVYKMGKKYRHTADGIFSTSKSRQTYYHKHNLPGAKPFEINRRWFREFYDTQPKKCCYCDIPEEYMKHVTGEFGVHGEQLSMDCIDNNKGYVVGNIALSCHRCNNTKSVLFTFDEMREIGQRYIKPKWQKIVGEKIE